MTFGVRTSGSPLGGGVGATDRPTGRRARPPRPGAAVAPPRTGKAPMRRPQASCLQRARRRRRPRTLSASNADTSRTRRATCAAASAY